MLLRASAARHLAATGPVWSVSLSRTALIERVKEHLHTEVPADEIANEGRVLKLLGFVPQQLDYEATELGLLEAQLAGYYEPSDRTMYLVNDLPEDESRATLAHELVHALQDQHWDLRARTKWQPGQGDRGFAVSALAEGDATLAMFDVLLRGEDGEGHAKRLPIRAIVDQIRQSVSSTEQSGVPHLMRAALAAPYIYGSLFVNTLRERGGWSAVDRAWENPPTTSEQILHPERWESEPPPLRVQVPSPRQLGPGFSRADEDTYGELSLRLMLDEWLGEGKAEAWTDGWAGDQGVLFKRDDVFAFALHFRRDKKAADTASKGTANSMASLLARVEAVLSVNATSKVARDKGGFCIERAELGPLAFAAKDDSLALVAGPVKARGREWVGVATCLEALPWAHEIEAAP